jgi:hypothetical protein
MMAVYDVAAGGRRFLLVESTEAETQPLTLLTNWQAPGKR